MSNKGEPPTRVLPLPLLGKGIHPLLRFRKDRGISPSAEGDLGLCPKYPQAFREKLDQNFPTLVCANIVRLTVEKKA